jgi:hypothetical protein
MAHEITHVKFETFAMRQGHLLDMLTSGERGEKFRQSDGVTNYSKEWWKNYEANPTLENRFKAFHETLAEMASEEESTGTIPGAPEWRHLYNEVNSHWQRRA